MNARITKIAVVAAMALSTIFVSAAANAQVPYPHPDSIHQRLRDQHSRIYHGVKNGRLTYREAARLRARDARIRHQVALDRFRHNGHLTPREHRHVERELNHSSHHIWHERHD